MNLINYPIPVKENIAVLFREVSNLLAFQCHVHYTLTMFCLGGGIFFKSLTSVANSYEIHHHASVGLTLSIMPNIASHQTLSPHPITLGQWLLIIYK